MICTNALVASLVQTRHILISGRALGLCACPRHMCQQNLDGLVAVHPRTKGWAPMLVVIYNSWKVIDNLNPTFPKLCEAFFYFLFMASAAK